MRSLLSIVSPFHFALALAVAIGSASSSTAATIYASSGMESASGPLPYVAGDGGLSVDSLILFQNSGISESLAASDPDSAAAWVASLPDDALREIANISLGETITDPAVFNAALRVAMERWLALSGSENTERTEFLDRDRGRGRGGESTDREIALNWINSNPSLAADPAFGSGSPASAVPEPSVSLLAALAGLGLLRRRR